ncbi:MAG: DNA gyrase subunit A, partial [Candidatus Gracilibacteria bacterium]
MESSYLEYAMSVIVSRALPDVRDGLKPVHRRILYAMNEIGLKSSSSFRKSAAVVGEVLAKYHPHGDAAVYDSMVRMAQDFSMRYTLVRGQGNFGSIDGDNAAAMRYTEAKLEKITDEMIDDIDKETIAWRENYDGRYKEPSVLPTKLPQLLLNGCTGIAVGMATSIPPHNLGEVIDGVLHLSDNPEATVEDLFKFIKGPDFPTGGILYDINDIKTAYLTGRGGMVVRAKTEIVEKKGGRFDILVSEIPYMVNKSALITKIAELVRDKKIVGITDIRD